MRVQSWAKKISWRRACKPTLVFLPGDSHGQRSLAGYHPWGHKKLDRTEATEHKGMHHTELLQYSILPVLYITSL